MRFRKRFSKSRFRFFYFHGFPNDPFYFLTNQKVTHFTTLDCYYKKLQPQRSVFRVPSRRHRCQCIGSFSDGACDPYAGADANGAPTSWSVIHLISIKRRRSRRGIGETVRWFTSPLRAVGIALSLSRDHTAYTQK